MYVCIYVCMYVCIIIYTHTYIYISHPLNPCCCIIICCCMSCCFYTAYKGRWGELAVRDMRLPRTTRLKVLKVLCAPK